MNDFFFERAELALKARRLAEAIQFFDAAQHSGSNPDSCSAGRWECHMLMGQFELAWQESDKISARGNPDPNRFWDGRPLSGRRVLIRCLHGLGDTIQFVRYVPKIREIARSVTIEAQPQLKSLLAQSQLADEVITWQEPEPPWDQQIEVMELPRIFRSTAATIPRKVPYLLAAKSRRLPHRPNATDLQVGVVWESSAFNPARSIPIEQFAGLWDIPGVTFFSLQYGAPHADLNRWADRIWDMHDHLKTVLDTAKLIACLDLVITVDTMTAHLAGALGVPVWTLLPYCGDWRWMLDREDSPWYPTMRLFRQPAPGNWTAVIERVQSELLRLREGTLCYSDEAPGIMK